MKKYSSITLLIVSLIQTNIVFAENLIAISAQQSQTLGITVTPIAIANSVMSNQLPGEIVIPIGQERVISSPQSGLIDALNVAAGQSVKRGQSLGNIKSTELIALQRDYLRGKNSISA